MEVIFCRPDYFQLFEIYYIQFWWEKKVSLDYFLCFKELWAPAEVIHGESYLCRMFIQVMGKTHPRGYESLQ